VASITLLALSACIAVVSTVAFQRRDLAAAAT
jgi:hypothetical protein